MPNKATYVLRECTDIVERRSNPEDGFFRHEGSIQIIVYVVNVA